MWRVWTFILGANPSPSIARVYLPHVRHPCNSHRIRHVPFEVSLAILLVDLVVWLSIIVRTKGTVEDLASLSSVLNWRNDTPLAHLSGILPFKNHSDPHMQFKRRIYDLSDSPGRVSPDSDVVSKSLQVLPSITETSATISGSTDDIRALGRLPRIRAACNNCVR